MGPLDFVPDLLDGGGGNLRCGPDRPYRSIHRIPSVDILGWAAREISGRGRFMHTPASRTPWLSISIASCAPHPFPS